VVSTIYSPYGEDEEPVVETRRYRGDQDRRRGWDEEPPGYAYRESPPFGYRPGPPRFGPFDWLFR
jgi:hypothetical protein